MLRFAVESHPSLGRLECQIANISYNISAVLSIGQENSMFQDRRKPEMLSILPPTPPPPPPPPPPPLPSNFDLDRIRSSIKRPLFLHFQTFRRPLVCMYGLVVSGRREAFSTSSLVVRQVYFLEITRTVCRIDGNKKAGALQRCEGRGS